MSTNTQTYDIKIDSLGAQGDGVGTLPDGRRAFVSGTLAGETVRARVQDEKPDGVFCAVVEVLEPAANRMAAPCPHYDRCGGCAIQHMDDASYSNFKMDAVRRALDQHGLEPETMDGPFISAPGTRRRATMAMYRSGQRVLIGFNERRSRSIVDLQTCLVLKPRLVALVPALRALGLTLLESGHGMDITMMSGDGDAVDLVFRPWKKTQNKHAQKNRQARNRKEPKLKQKQIDGPSLAILEALYDFANEHDIARIHWQDGFDKPDDLTPVADRAPFTVTLGGHMVRPSPGAFLQATEDGQAALTEVVLSGVGDARNIVDLYAGCGTFALALLRDKRHVTAVEGWRPAIDALSRAASELGGVLDTAHRDLVDDPLNAKELKDFDAVVIDPPRVGAKDQMREIANANVRTVVSVSCNPATFARDGAILKDAGFKLTHLRVVDQFLWSTHVELVGVFVNQNYVTPPRLNRG